MDLLFAGPPFATLSQQHWVISKENEVPLWIQAGGWGLLAGGALVIGAAIGYFFRVPTRAVAGVMAFGSGVLISALSFELIDEVYRNGGLGATALGFLGGATVSPL